MISLMSLAVAAILIDPMWPLVVLGYNRKKSMVLRDITAARTTRLAEVFHGVAPVKLNGLKRYRHGRFVALTGAFVTAKVKTTAGTAPIPAMMDLAIGLGFFCVRIYGGQEIISGEKTVADFMPFFAGATLAFQPLRRWGPLTGI